MLLFSGKIAIFQMTALPILPLFTINKTERVQKIVVVWLKILIKVMCNLLYLYNNPLKKHKISKIKKQSIKKYLKIQKILLLKIAIII